MRHIAFHTTVKAQMNSTAPVSNNFDGRNIVENYAEVWHDAKTGKVQFIKVKMEAFSICSRTIHQVV